MYDITPDSVPLHLPRRLPRINGDMRRRKKRLRRKLEKRDAVEYANVIKSVSDLWIKHINSEFIKGVRNESCNQ
jgi:hypothetical protein